MERRLWNTAQWANFTWAYDANIKSGWWFGTFFIFAYIGNNHPNWLIFFRGVAQPPTRNVEFRSMVAKFCSSWLSPGVSPENPLGFSGCVWYALEAYHDLNHSWQFGTIRVQQNLQRGIRWVFHVCINDTYVQAVQVSKCCWLLLLLLLLLLFGSFFNVPFSWQWIIIRESEGWRTTTSLQLFDDTDSNLLEWLGDKTWRPHCNKTGLPSDKCDFYSCFIHPLVDTSTSNSGRPGWQLHSTPTTFRSWWLLGRACLDSLGKRLSPQHRQRVVSGWTGSESDWSPLAPKTTGRVNERCKHANQAFDTSRQTNSG